MTIAAPPPDAAAAQRLAAVRARIDAAAREAGRDPAAVTLVAISKQQPDERIAAVLAAGQRVFGENRVQEAEAHWAARRDTIPALRLHMVGPLQTNKAREAVALFDAIHSVDRPRLAEALAKEMARSGRRPACFIEINTGEEPQKAGVLPADADAFIERCRGEFGLMLAGLMCLPPRDAVPAPHFALLATIARRHGLAGLSMGMSADYAAAVTLGATHVRVGTAIFGDRAPR
ncbi:MAG: YggS family pyridoxal phosphate-dependent enzyme [Alphaproteobacteria bacterium]|nr:YggS family pyridoxal phosphate-dependent enzyme [Alphaproteobacteria bacterium]